MIIRSIRYRNPLTAFPYQTSNSFKHTSIKHQALRKSLSGSFLDGFILWTGRKNYSWKGEAMVDKTWAKWSYFFVNVYNSVVESVSGPGVTVELASELAGRNMAEVSWWLGEQGWELVGCASPGPSWLVLIFKRLVSEQ